MAILILSTIFECVLQYQGLSAFKTTRSRELRVTITSSKYFLFSKQTTKKLTACMSTAAKIGKSGKDKSEMSLLHSTYSHLLHVPYTSVCNIMSHCPRTVQPRDQTQLLLQLSFIYLLTLTMKNVYTY